MALEDAFVHLDLRRLDMVAEEHKSDSVAAAPALEEEKMERN
jgi:hypothetical protein